MVYERKRIPAVCVWLGLRRGAGSESQRSISQHSDDAWVHVLYYHSEFAVLGGLSFHPATATFVK